MNSDFLDAHLRHWEDAEMLFLAAPARLANADHLYGFSAECGLKRLMVIFGMTIDVTGTPMVRDDRCHVNAVWQRYESYRSGHPSGLSYTLPLTSPFSDWKAEQRYANRSEFDSIRIQAHRGGAEAVCNLIAQAQRDGLV